jgi:hypothetical protein
MRAYERRVWLWIIHEGRCACCGRFALTVAGLVEVKLSTFTVAICPRCARVGGASRLRAVDRGAEGAGHMIDRDSYPGASRPALKPEHIGYPKKTAAVLTVADVDPNVEVPDDSVEGGQRKILVVIFREFPDLTFYTNKTSREALIEQLGLDEKRWPGKKVPLIAVNTNNPKTHKPQPSLWVADPDEWDTHLRHGTRAATAAKAPRGGRRRAAAK